MAATGDTRAGYILPTYEFTAQEYELPRLDVDVLFFRATSGPICWDDLDRWRRCSSARFESHYVAGTHLTHARDAALFEPIGRVLGERIAALRMGARNRADTRTWPELPTIEVS